MIVASLYTALLGLVALYEVTRRRPLLVDFLTIFHAFFVVTYLLPAITFLVTPGKSDSWRFLAQYPEAASSAAVLVSMAIAYTALVLGFRFGGMQRAGAFPLVAFKYGERTQLACLIGFFACCLAAFLLYTYGHGGIVELMLSGKDIRTHRQHAGVLQYFGYFAAGLSLSSLLFFGLSRCARSPQVRRRAAWFFILSFLTALAYAIGTAGRGNIGFVFLVVLITWLNLDRRGMTARKFLGIACFSGFLFFLVAYGKSAIWTIGALADGPYAYIEAFSAHREWYVAAVGGANFSDAAIVFLRNFDHALVSVHLALTNPDVYQSPRLFFDWPRALLEIVPGISQPEFVVSKTPSALNRDYLIADGYVPPGWIAMKIINGGVAWMMTGGFIVGFIGGYLNRLVAFAWSSSPLMPGLFTFVAFFWKDYIVGPDPFMVIMPNLPFVLFVAWFGWMTLLKLRRHSRVEATFT